MSHHWVRALLVFISFPVSFLAGCWVAASMEEWTSTHTPNLNTLWGWGPYVGGACMLGMFAVVAWEITR